MGFNGAGTYSRVTPSYSGSTVWQQEEAGGFGRVATRHDFHDQDVAEALTNGLTKDGQSTVSSNLTLGGNNLTNLGYATARASAMPIGQHVDGFPLFGGTSTGAPDYYTLSISPSPTAYVEGMEVYFFAHQTSVTTSTYANSTYLSIGTLPFHELQSKRDGVTPYGIGVAAVRAGNLVHCVFTSENGGRWNILSEEFQDWASWTPEVVIDGSGTVALGPVTTARYMVKDNLCFWNLDIICYNIVNVPPLNYIGVRCPPGVPCRFKDHFTIGVTNGFFGLFQTNLALQVTNQNGIFWGATMAIGTPWINTPGYLLQGQGVYEIA